MTPTVKAALIACVVLACLGSLALAQPAPGAHDAAEGSTGPVSADASPAAAKPGSGAESTPEDSPPEGTRAALTADEDPGPDMAPKGEKALTSAEDAARDPLGTIAQLVAAVRSGQWRLAAALGLGLVMLLLTRVRKKVKWFRGDRGGAVLVGILALGGGLISALASSAPLDWKLFLGAAGVMWTAVGGYTWIKKVIWPKDD